MLAELCWSRPIGQDKPQQLRGVKLQSCQQATVWPSEGDAVAFVSVRPSEVPAFDIVAERINAVSPEISISGTAYDSDCKLYCLRLLGPSSRNADLHLSREQLDDLTVRTGWIEKRCICTSKVLTSAHTGQKSALP